MFHFKFYWWLGDSDQKNKFSIHHSLANHELIPISNRVLFILNIFRAHDHTQ